MYFVAYVVIFTFVSVSQVIVIAASEMTKMCSLTHSLTHSPPPYLLFAPPHIRTIPPSHISFPFLLSLPLPFLQFRGIWGSLYASSEGLGRTSSRN